MPCSIKRWRGAAISPEERVPQVYLPAREGSLQTEIVPTARRQGLQALPVEPALDALLAEIGAGHPVLVLQNLGLSWMPRWNYAVAIGYDLEWQQLAPENSAITHSLKEIEGLTAPSVETCLTLLACPIQSKRLKASAQGDKSRPPPRQPCKHTNLGWTYVRNQR